MSHLKKIVIIYKNITNLSSNLGSIWCSLVRIVQRVSITNIIKGNMDYSIFSQQ